MPEMDETKKQTASSLGCSLALTSVLGTGLVGNFIKDGLSWPWIATMSLILLAGIGALSAALQKLLESGGGGGGGGGGRSAPDPKPDPSRKKDLPKATETSKAPETLYWPPNAGL